MGNTEKILNQILQSQQQMQGDITELKSSQQQMQDDITDLKINQQEMQGDIQQIQIDLKETKSDVKSIKSKLDDIEIKNAERHIDIYKEIKEMRRDFAGKNHSTKFGRYS